MTTSKWNGDPIPSTAVNADGSYKNQTWTATARQTHFDITVFAYAQNTGSLMVFVNGSKQRPIIDYAESSPTSFDISSELDAEDIVEAWALVGGVASQSAEASAAAAAISAAAALNYYNMIVGLNVPALPLAIALGGTGATVKQSAFNNLSPLVTKGDLLVTDGVNNQKLGIAADNSVLVPDSTSPTGLAWKPARPMIDMETTATITLGKADAGKSIVTTANLNIDASANLFPGWTIWITNDNVRAGNTTGPITVSLQGTDVFREVGQPTLTVNRGATVGLELDPASTPAYSIFTVITAKGNRQYIKVVNQQANGTSLGVPVVGLNERPLNTTVECTIVGWNPLLLGNGYVSLPRGTWQYRISTMHSGTAATKLRLVDSFGGTVVGRGPSNIASSFSNTLTGKLVTTGSDYHIQEWFSAATGTLGSAISSGDPEIYIEAEFWRE